MEDDVKRCGRCRETKALAEFNRNRTTRDGLQAACSTCMRAYQAEHYRRNRERHIARVRQDNQRRKSTAAAELETYLRTHPCVDCGIDDPRVLELDHLEGSLKTANVSALVGAGLPWTRILAEISKCEVRCANCHRIATMTRGAFYRSAWGDGTLVSPTPS